MRAAIIIIVLVAALTVVLYFFGTGLIQREAGVDVEVSTPATEGPESPEE